MDEELAIAVAALDRALEIVGDAEAARGARTTDPGLDPRVRHRVRDDAAFADVGRLQLELRLDQCKQIAVALETPGERAQHEGQRDERQVGDDEVEALARQRGAGEPAGVDPFERDNARVGAQPRVQLAVTDVDADHRGRAERQQHIGEAAGALADVECMAASDR